MLNAVIGIVESNVDVTQSGSFMAKFQDIGESPVKVIYTSQMYKKGNGGHFAVPERGDEVLAFHDTKTNNVYYQSTIMRKVEFDALEQERIIPNFTTLGGFNDKYNTFAQPVKVTYQNQAGAGLCITRNYEPPPSIRTVNSVALISEKNKRISLDDSPETDGIHIKTHNKDGIIITGDETPTMGAGVLQAKTKGPQYYTCMTGHIEMAVQEGRDINILNTSTGTMAQQPSQSSWPNGPNAQPPKKFGGIYLKSDNGDLSLVSKSDEGRIFIKTPKGEIQITEEGNIVIKNAGDISVDSEGSVNIRAGGDFRVQASNVDIGAQTNIKASAGGTGAISSDGAMVIDGATIDLKPTSKPGPATAP